MSGNTPLVGSIRLRLGQGWKGEEKFYEIDNCYCQRPSGYDYQLANISEK